MTPSYLSLLASDTISHVLYVNERWITSREESINPQEFYIFERQTTKQGFCLQTPLTEHLSLSEASFSGWTAENVPNDSSSLHFPPYPLSALLFCLFCSFSLHTHLQTPFEHWYPSPPPLWCHLCKSLGV